MPNCRYHSQDYIRRGGCGRNQSASSSVYPNRNHRAENAGCSPRDPIAGMPLAMAYVPWQEWGSLCDARQGFCRGTIFEDLNKPFQGMGGCRR
ncbi:spore coat associated protein CotJA [Lachnospiraceae bacterium KGMB03038]|nr:spore coat associated protein CotJA [Lachnospiraceae bacterium KGMB03038]